MSTWELRTLTFKGVVAGASHYMGTLYFPYTPNGRTQVEVEAILTPEYAKALSTDDFTYRPGVECERFLNRDDMVNTAIEQFMKLAEPGDELVTYMYERPIAIKE